MRAAELVLRASDLGPSWSEVVGASRAAGDDEPLSSALPDRAVVDTAEAAFGDGRDLAVCVCATLVDGAGAIAREVVSSASFARSFLDAVAADVVAPPGRTVLGPVLRAAPDPVPAPAGVSLSHHVGTLSGGGASGLVPVTVDVVTVVGRSAVALLWFASGPGPFPHLVLTTATASVGARVAGAG